MTTHKAASPSELIIGLIIGLMFGMGLGITFLAYMANVDRYTTYTCSTQVEGDEGFTVKVDGQTHQCTWKGDK